MHLVNPIDNLFDNKWSVTRTPTSISYKNKVRPLDEYIVNEISVNEISVNEISVNEISVTVPISNIAYKTTFANAYDAITYIQRHLQTYYETFSH